MGIVFPLVGPLAVRMGGGSAAYVQQCFGAIMGGSIFGNLCSPISDTTILAVVTAARPSNPQPASARVDLRWLASP